MKLNQDYITGDTSKIRITVCNNSYFQKMVAMSFPAEEYMRAFWRRRILIEGSFLFRLNFVPIRKHLNKDIFLSI